MSSESVIDGVRFIPLRVNADPRGTFTEVIKVTGGTLPVLAQVSVSTTFPGIIKAFHLHQKQEEIWYLLEGNARIVLVDLRKQSRTYGQRIERVLGAEITQEIVFIPKGVAHGYQVLGSKPLRMLYVADTAYNPANPDEVRIPYDDPQICFDWSIKNR